MVTVLLWELSCTRFLSLFCHQVAMDNRDGRMAAEQERIEVGLELLGATAVEDKLQV